MAGREAVARGSALASLLQQHSVGPPDRRKVGGAPELTHVSLSGGRYHIGAARYAELMAEPVAVDRVLEEGAERLRPLAQATMAEVREKMGLR